METSPFLVMATEVDICNLALSLLGEKADVVSVNPSDGSENAGLCNRWFPMAKQRIFEDADWGFAQRRVRLSELANVDPKIYGAAKVYAFPSDAVRLIGLYEVLDEKENQTEFSIDPDDARRFDDEIEIPRSQWRVEYNTANSNRMIITNVEKAVAHYTAYIDSVALYPAYFTEPLVVLLASYLVGPIKRQSSASTEATNLMKQYQQSLSLAKTIDAQATRQKTLFVPTKISSRWV